MPADDARTPLFELLIADAPQKLIVISFVGREHLSKSYSFDIRVAAPLIDADAIDQLFVGQAAHLRFGQEGETERWVHGVVRRMEAEGAARDNDDRHGYRLQLVPALRLLGEKKDSRIFQDQTVPEIVSIVLRASGVTLRTQLTKSYRKRVYCVQHQETDLRFVERLLAEEGIFYFFEHPAGETASEILVLADEVSACKPIAGNASFRVASHEGLVGRDDHDLSRFRLRRRIEPGSVLLKSFDFLRPSFDLRGEAKVSDLADPLGVARGSGAGAAPSAPGAIAAAARSAGAAAGRAVGAPAGGAPAGGADDQAPTGYLDPDGIEQYHHHYGGELEQTGVDDASARTRLEQHRRKVWVGLGQGHSPSLSPGHTIDIEEAQVERHPGSYTLFEVEHEGHNPRALRSAAPVPFTYRNRFQCVPASTPFRPRPPRARTQQVLETATVVGPAGQEIHTDAHGRIKVQFHWDREGKRDAHSSCWIRVMQPWAGAGWGFQFIPRVGMEVMVAFLAGDTDRPMVMGSVYNPEHPPPFPLPAEKSRSGIRTQSTPGGQGYNEISFEDKLGEETIVIRAQSNLNETVLVDQITKVGNDRSLVVEGNHTSSIGGDMTLGVAGSKHDMVKANRSESTTGSVNVSVKGNQSEVVQGNRTSEVHGASRGQYHGSANAHVDQAASLTAVGSLSVNVGASEPASGVLHAKGSWFVGADEDIVLTAARSISFQCGDSLVRLTAELIEISAKAIAVKGEDKTTVRGDESLLELTAEAKLAAPATRLFGKSSSMELTADAYLKGTKIKLNFREGDPPTVTDETTPPETRTLKLKLSDGGFNGFKSRPFEMTVDGVRFEGTTDGDGNVAQDIPKTATKAHLIVWEGDAPTGKSHVWDLAIGAPPPASSVEGARSRLANLGYKVGSGAKMDPITRQAVEGFQEDYDLEPTGELDGATTAKLTEIHGH